MRLTLNPSSVTDYETFLRVKALPKYSFEGRTAIFPDEYAARVGLVAGTSEPLPYKPHKKAFDYQRDISAMAIRKRKFAVFADCGLGKTLILFEFARHAMRENVTGKVLLVSPLMVIGQTIAEYDRFYPNSMPIRRLSAAELPGWLESNAAGIAITNYEAITDDLPMVPLHGLILDESSMLKSHYGKWGTRLIEMGRGVPFKLCATGTPAPNDRIEYANHAVFLDAFPTVNSFLARFFVNRGETGERWELKAHALDAFYVALSHWCIFLSNPAVYGWKDNTEKLPPIIVHRHEVPISDAQRSAMMTETGAIFVDGAGGIGTRGTLARIGKGHYRGERIESLKTRYVADLVAGWSAEESTIVWCKYNAEQDDIAAAIPGCGNISGDTPMDERERIVAGFKAGTIRTIVTKPKLMGFGLNLQVCTRQVFAGLQDSYEEFYQAVKRSNRYGSTRPLNVHIPVTELEAPMVENVMRKAGRVEADTAEQERLFASRRVDTKA